MTGGRPREIMPGKATINTDNINICKEEAERLGRFVTVHRSKDGKAILLMKSEDMPGCRTFSPSRPNGPHTLSCKRYLKGFRPGKYHTLVLANGVILAKKRYIEKYKNELTARKRFVFVAMMMAQMINHAMNEAEHKDKKKKKGKRGKK